MLIKTAVLGYGRSGSTLHAGPIEELPDFEMTAVCDIDPDARVKAFNRFGCKIYENYADMLEKESLDLVVIVTRSDQHCQMACECLNAGANVLVTKPWAINADEAKRMIAAAKGSGKMLLPWLPARWGSDLNRLKELISSGVIGNVFQVRRSEYSFAVRHDWQTLKKYGGGYLLNWGPHLVDQPVQLIGQNVKSVYGHMKQVINPGDVEDVFYAVMKTDGNVTIISEYNICAPCLPNWVVQGDKGTIFVDNDSIQIHKAKFADTDDSGSYGDQAEIEIVNDAVDGGNIINMDNRYGDPLAVYPHIARAVRGEAPYAVTLDSALHLSEILDAVRASAQTGEAVRL